MLPGSSSTRMLRSRGSIVIVGLVVTTGTGCTEQQLEVSVAGSHTPGQASPGVTMIPFCMAQVWFTEDAICEAAVGCSVRKFRVTGTVCTGVAFSVWKVVGGVVGPIVPGMDSGPGIDVQPAVARLQTIRMISKKAEAGAVLHHIAPIWADILSSWSAIVPSEAESPGAGRHCVPGRGRPLPDLSGPFLPV